MTDNNRTPDGMMVWISKTIADSHHLTAAQFGAWFRLRMAMWRNGGALPNDSAKLARIAGASTAWRQISGPVLEMFTIDGDKIVDPQLVQELNHTCVLIEKRREYGRAGGLAKSLKNKEQALAKATVLPEQNSSIETKTKNREESLVPSGDGTVVNLFSDPTETKQSKKPSKRERYDRPYSPEFEQFWNAYPPRDGSRDKKEAWVSFQIAVENGAKPEAIIAGAKQYSEQERKLGNHHTRFVKLAATWLNEHCWDDYTATPASATKRPEVLVIKGTEQWKAWVVRYQATRGVDPPDTDVYPDGKYGRIERGWYFDAPWPPGYQPQQQATTAEVAA